MIALLAFWLVLSVGWYTDRSVKFRAKKREEAIAKAKADEAFRAAHPETFKY